MPEVLSAPLVVEFPFTRSLGPVQSAFLTGLRERTVLGVKTSGGQVLVPPVEYDPATAEEIRDLVEVAPTGTVTTFCIVNIKARNLDIEVPYVYGHIALDGADLALHGRIGGIPYDQVRMGLRVEPVWTEGGRYPDHYRPTGEPDADYDAYKELI
ncbi:Zn-ribbon domain-containing OB-fold protein [Streptomyces chryseus]|uniref:Zn-ribbon domain-containing OB-fold protein n=1 Tax=Streptomyces chryseus TaxID=68186 RepID=UPI00110FA52F|nr:OB-fold domain-containing protein [Streptomyces chryseus]